jgi:hypothetical protein
MLIIRPEQREAFKETEEAAFAESLCAYLRERHGDTKVLLPGGESSVAGLADGELYAMVARGLRRAARYGLTSRASLRAFIVLMFLAAPNFDEHPIISHALCDEWTPPDDRLEGLWEKTNDQNWEAVRADYDPEAWGSDF